MSKAVLKPRGLLCSLHRQLPSKELSEPLWKLISEHFGTLYWEQFCYNVFFIYFFCVLFLVLICTEISCEHLSNCFYSTKKILLNMDK